MPQADTSPSSEAATACAQTLRRLGWSQAKIDQILAGPTQSSIHQIAGRPTKARNVPSVEASTVAEEEGGDDKGTARAPQPPAAPAYDPATYAGVGQKQIADAVWASVNAGDPMPLAQIARQTDKLPGPLQAYLLAASVDVKRFYKDLAAWKRDFDQAQQQGNAQRKQDTHEGEAVAGAAAGVIAAVATAAAAANAVPVVGQAVSAVMALGLAIATAVIESNPLPVRKAEDQIRPGYEGVSVFRGLVIEPPEGPYDGTYLRLKQAVVQDEVAFGLPPVPTRTPFDFAPRLVAFQESAHQLRLYAEDGAPK
jgi:hypothetical protein